jgi:hypothetical protein
MSLWQPIQSAPHGKRSLVAVHTDDGDQAHTLDRHQDNRPVLFLDIDGVLNSVQWARRVQRPGILGIDPDTIPHLQRIVDETDCDIVVSSTWRIGRQAVELREILLNAGMRSPCPVIDRTPGGGGFRGNQIAEWLENAGFDGRFACLDDDSDFLPSQPLVQTDNQIGLTSAHADRCIAILRPR